jgi:hypothetical protein
MGCVPSLYQRIAGSVVDLFKLSPGRNTWTAVENIDFVPLFRIPLERRNPKSGTTKSPRHEENFENFLHFQEPL